MYSYIYNSLSYISLEMERHELSVSDFSYFSGESQFTPYSGTLSSTEPVSLD